MRAVLSLLLLALPMVLAANWTVSPYSQTIMMDINMISDKVGFIAGGQNGEGANCIKTTDGGMTWTELPTANALMFMSAAAASETSAVIGGIGFLGGSMQYLTDAGASFTNASEPKVIVEETQSAYTIGETEGLGYAVVGSWQIYGENLTYNGVAVSADGGASYSIIDTGNLVPARYGAFPTPSTWFVTFGEWPNTTESFGRPISRHLHIHQHGETGMSYHHNYKHKDSNLDDQGEWIGQIMRTTDGGVNWDLLFSNGTFYFNQIACPSESVCYAVAENDDFGFVYKTADGGATWNVIMQESGVSLMSVEALSEDELWIGGGVLAYPVVGHTYHSVDGGATFEQNEVPDNYITALSFPDAAHGFATSIDTEQQSGIIIYA